MPAQGLKTRSLREHRVFSSPHDPDDIRMICQMRLVLACVQLIYHARVEYLFGPSRGGRHLALARQVMHYLAHCCFGISYSELARLVAIAPVSPMPVVGSRTRAMISWSIKPCFFWSHLWSLWPQ